MCKQGPCVRQIELGLRPVNKQVPCVRQFGVRPFLFPSPLAGEGQGEGADLYKQAGLA
jgi:hypothetical protein